MCKFKAINSASVFVSGAHVCPSIDIDICDIWFFPLTFDSDTGHSMFQWSSDSRLFSHLDPSPFL